MDEFAGKVFCSLCGEWVYPIEDKYCSNCGEIIPNHVRKEVNHPFVSEQKSNTGDSTEEWGEKEYFELENNMDYAEEESITSGPYNVARRWGTLKRSYHKGTLSKDKLDKLIKIWNKLNINTELPTFIPYHHKNKVLFCEGIYILPDDDKFYEWKEIIKQAVKEYDDDCDFYDDVADFSPSELINIAIQENNIPIMGYCPSENVYSIKKEVELDARLLAIKNNL